MFRDNYARKILIRFIYDHLRYEVKCQFNNIVCVRLLLKAVKQGFKLLNSESNEVRYSHKKIYILHLFIVQYYGRLDIH